jgi:cell wall-associated NlpC family hydrolase
MGKKILKRAASLLAVLALAFSVIVGFQLPANAASCKSNAHRSDSVRVGSRGSDVRSAQCLLRKAGFSVKIDGSFSAADAAKVRKVQRKYHLSATGRVRGKTWSALVKAAKTKRFKASSSSGSSKASASSRGRIALAFAKAQLGERYRFAGAGPNVWDCSGLTMKAWAKAGVKLPHHADNQRKVGKRVSRANLRLGDLVYFYHPIHHVGIYAGNGRVIHAPNPRKRVEYIKISYMPYNSASRPSG